MTRNSLKTKAKKGIVGIITIGIIGQNVQSISAVSLTRIKEKENVYGPYYGVDINENRLIYNQEIENDKQERLSNLKQFQYYNDGEIENTLSNSEEFTYEEAIDEVTTIYVNEEDDNLKQMVIGSMPENYFDGESYQPIDTRIEENSSDAYQNETNTIASIYSKDLEKDGLELEVSNVHVYYRPILGTYEVAVKEEEIEEEVEEAIPKGEEPQEDTETKEAVEEIIHEESFLEENEVQEEIESEPTEEEISEEEIPHEEVSILEEEQDFSTNEPWMEMVEQVEEPWVYENQIVYPLTNETNIRYSVFNGYIREDIILNTTGNPSEYAYDLWVEGGEAELIENEIWIRNHWGQVVLVLGAPRAYDSGGNETNITVRYEGHTVFYEVSEEWLNSAERIYPIIIDPDFRQVMAHEGMDTSVIQSTPYITVGNIDLEPLNWRITDILPARLYVGNDPEYGDSISFYKVRSDTLADFTGKYIKTAIASFPVYDKSSENTVYGCTITSDYDIGTAVYNNVNDALEHLENCTAVSYGNDVDVIEFDITDYVKGVVERKKVNSGVAFVLKDQEKEWIRFHSAEYYNYENGMGMSHSDRYPGTIIEYYENPDIADEMGVGAFTYVLRPFVQYNRDEGLIQFVAVGVDGKAPYESEVEVTIKDEKNEVYKKTISGFDNFYRFPDYPEIVDVPRKWTELESNYQLDELLRSERFEINRVYDVEIICKKDGKEEKKNSWFQVIEASEFDLLEKIANFYGMDIETIKTDNNLEDSLITDGNVLFLREPNKNKGKAYPHTNLSKDEKAQIDALLRGRNVACEYGNEPINFNTGNFLIEAEDFGLNIEGETFHFLRIYNSKAADEFSEMGYGWTHNLNSFIVKNRNGASLVLPDSKELYFQKEADGTYRNTITNQYQLQVQENHFVLEEKDTRKTYAFLENGMLGSILDANGKAKQFVYDANLYLQEVILENGEIIRFTYCNNVLEKVKTENSEITYQYDADDNLISFTDTRGEKVRYTYDTRHRMTSWEDRNGNTVVTNTYDDQNRVIAQVDGLGNRYDTEYKAYQTINTDPNGNKTIYEYDDKGATTRITYSDGRSVERRYVDYKLTYEKKESGIAYTYEYSNRDLVKRSRNDGFEEEWTYDTMHNLLSYKNSEGQTRSYTYNDRNQETSITNALGITTYKAYDEKGNLTSIRDGNGNTTWYEYNDKNQLIKLTYPDGSVNQYGYNGDGFLANTTDSYGNTTYYNHNERNELVLVTNPDGTTIKYEYDKNGNQIAIEDENGNITRYSYNLYGDVIEKIDPAGYHTTYTYDRNRNCIGIAYPDGSQETFVYDNRNRLIEEDRNGHNTQYLYGIFGIETIRNEKGQEKTVGYDGLGRVEKEIGFDGLERTFHYDSLGNLIEEKDEKGNITEYAYDKEGQVIRKETAFYTETYTYDANGNQTSVFYQSDDKEYSQDYTYNERDFVLSESNPRGFKKQYHYDGIHLIAQVDERGDETTFEYDSRNRIIKEVLSDGLTRSYTYDGVGNLLSKTDTNGNSERYRYDKQYNTIAYTNGRGYTTTYQYDAMKRLLSSLSPLGYKESYTYDIDGNLLSKTIQDRLVERYEYDAYGRVVSETKNGYTTSYEYDAYDEVIKKVEPSGLITEFTYDKYHRLTEEMIHGEIVKAYTYDTRDYVLTEKDLYGEMRENTYNNDGDLTSTTYHSNTTKYTYDENHNVIKENDSLGNIKESLYDENGNLIEETINGKRITYAYDSDNQNIRITNTLGYTTIYTKDHEGNVLSIKDNNDSKTEYTYDENYNLIEKRVDNILVIAYTYDEEDTIIKETDGEGYQKQYQYDTYRNLIKKVDERGYATEYTYDEKFQLIEEKTPNQAITKYTYNEKGQRVETKDPMGHVFTYTYDYFGNVIKAIDPIGGIALATYNAKNQLIETKDSRGLVTTYTYNTYNQIIDITKNGIVSTRNTYDAYGRQIEVENSLGAKTSYQYDKVSNLRSITYANGGVETYEYDSENQVVKKIDVLGTASEYQYDGIGNIIQETINKERTTQYTYNAFQLPTQRIDSRGNITRYTYNARQELVEEIDALNGTTKYTYSPTGELVEESDKNGNKKSTILDEVGNGIQTKDALGHIITNTYDKNGNIISVQNARGYTVNYEYNALGSLTKEYTQNQETVYTYNEANDLILSKSRNAKKETYSYDVYGNLVSHTQKNGQELSYSYDTEGQLCSRNHITYTYDCMGNLIRMEDDSGTTTYTYNLAQSLIETSQRNNKVQYTYNPYNEVASMRYEDGSKVQYTYDAMGNIASILYEGNYNERVTYEYDALNRETKENRNNRIFTITEYDAYGNIKHKKTTSNGQTYLDVFYEYNANHSLTKETKSSIGGSSTTNYTYNENDELISSTITKGNEIVEKKYVISIDGNLSELTDGKTTTRNEFNEQNQIIKSYHDGHTYTYTYDDNGNRTFEKRDDGATRSYTYDIFNRLTAIKDYDNAYFKYTYEGLDNRIKQYSIRHGQHYIDGEYIIEDKMDILIDRLRLSTTNEYGSLCLVAYYSEEEVPELPKDTIITDTFTYQEKVGEETQYHGEPGVCLIHDVDVAEIVYINDYTVENVQVLSEKHGDIAINYLFGNGRISSDHGEYIDDYADTVVEVLNHNGAIKGEYTYTNFGKRIEVFDIYNPYDDPIGYNGEYHEASELLYLRARYYDPIISNFTIEDTLRGTVEDPSSRNRYAYGRNNPKKFIDPSGHILTTMRQMADNGGRHYGNNAGCTVYIPNPQPQTQAAARNYTVANNRTEATINTRQYTSQTAQATHEQKVAWQAHIQQQARIEQQVNRYSYKQGGNTSVVTEAEARQEALKVKENIKKTINDTIEPSTKSYQSTNSKANAIKINLVHSAKNFDSIFSKTCGSLEDRVKQACEKNTEYRSSDEILKEIKALLQQYGYSYGQNPRMIELYHEYVLQKRYEHNQEMDELYRNKATNNESASIGPGIHMNGQGRYEGYQIGTYGNMPSHGCGPISVYNALISLGDYEDPSDIIRYFDEKTGGFGLFGTGLMGTDTQAVYDYFSEHDYTAKIIYSASDDIINKAPKEHDVVIIMYEWMIGGHYITVTYDDKISQYKIYNEFNDSTRSRHEKQSLTSRMNSPDYKRIITKTIIMVDKK